MSTTSDYQGEQYWILTILSHLENNLIGILNKLLYSDEIRGEILFLLFKLSLLNATPWDNTCDNDNVDLSAIGRSLLQLSLEILFKTQNDAVRLNCIGQYISSLCFIWMLIRYKIKGVYWHAYSRLRKEYCNAFLTINVCLFYYLY